MNTPPNALIKRRSSVRFPALAWSALVWWAGACGNAENKPNDGNLGTIGSSSASVGPVVVAPTSGPVTGVAPGTGVGTGSGAISGGNTGVAPTDAPTSNGTAPVAPTSGAVTSGGTTSAEPCVDVEPPPDPEWPDATCATWAKETEECDAPWFSKYCDLSCGRCTPQGGTPEPEPEPCVDVEPPPDPEWPDATCATWAKETDECDAPWFANYCDVSCGRCVPEGGIPEPEPKKCEDIAPPETPEWPGATCAEWATETEECGADWFANYCDVSCGRCVPEGGIPETPMGPDCSGENLPNVTGGQGYATRYWDCCQTHCSQFNGHRCGQDGVSGAGDQRSACEGGGSFACYDEAPRAVSDCLSYGYIAKANPNCGACYRIQFTGEGEHNVSDPGSQLIKGKQMIVKVSNTGGDVAHNQFDLMIPGGGVGRFDACSRQWNAQGSLGAQYGGFLTNCTGSHAAKKECVRNECMKIPAGSAREGCLWFVDWFEVADNPRFTSQEVNCPF